MLVFLRDWLGLTRKTFTLCVSWQTNLSILERWTTMWGSLKASKQFESHSLEWNVDFENAATYCIRKDNCTVIANSAGYRTMLQKLEMDVDDVDGQFWFLGRRCYRTHSTWINGWLDSHVSRMYHFTYKVVPPDLSGLLISLRPSTFSGDTWGPEYTRSNLTSSGIRKSTTAKN